MSGLLTTWGYKLTELNTLPDLITAEEFNAYTGSKYAGFADRIAAEIPAASAAVRNFVGWHLGPAAACELNTTFLDRRVTRIGADVLIQLPARHVTEIGSVSIDGTEEDSYVLDPTGLLRVLNCGGFERFTPIVATYTAGLPDALMAPIKELVAHCVTHAVAVPAGVTSEASGGVSVTYNANWINNARATGLASDNKELLIPYKVEGVF